MMSQTNDEPLLVNQVSSRSTVAPSAVHLASSPTLGINSESVVGPGNETPKARVSDDPAPLAVLEIPYAAFQPRAQSLTLFNIIFFCCAGAYLVGFVVAFDFERLGLDTISHRSMEPIVNTYAALTVGLHGLVLILGLFKLHAAWTSIQPLREMDPAQRDMPTPGKTILFMFIPLFNVYWIFPAWIGLFQRANELRKHRGLVVPVFGLITPLLTTILTAAVMVILPIPALIPLLDIKSDSWWFALLTGWPLLINGLFILAALGLYFPLIQMTGRIIRTFG